MPVVKSRSRRRKGPWKLQRILLPVHTPSYRQQVPQPAKPTSSRARSPRQGSGGDFSFKPPGERVPVAHTARFRALHTRWYLATVRSDSAAELMARIRKCRLRSGHSRPGGKPERHTGRHFRIDLCTVRLCGSYDSVRNEGQGSTGLPFSRRSSRPCKARTPTCRRLPTRNSPSTVGVLQRCLPAG